MGVRESKVEKYLDKQVTAVGGLTRKWVSPGRDGVPDRIVVHHGHVIFVEVKTVDGTLTKNQRREQKRLRDKGASVTTVYGNADVNKFVEGLLGRV
jgi:hypothetical protein